MHSAGAPNSHQNTSVVALGRPLRAPDAPLNPHIAMSSTFVGVDTPRDGERGYARSSNESWEPLEKAIAALEGSEVPGVSFASGMAAVSAAMSLAPIGSVVAVPSTSYNGTVSLARQLHSEGAIVLREVNALDIDATIAAFEGAALVWLESPTNPLLDVVDLQQLLSAARRAGAIAVVDNTFSTPLRQQPLTMGADVVVHSATKFISGHSDVLLGIAVTPERELRDRILSRRTLHGGIPGPFESWLGLRGLRTLAVRLDRAEANAAELATRLSEQTAVTRVRYPGLPTDPGHKLASAQMSGFGAIVSIEFATEEIASRFVGALRLATPATSLGGVETLVERRRRQLSEPATVPEELVRISVGIEHIDDLWADFEQAIYAATR